jgi:hypothetical protein
MSQVRAVDGSHISYPFIEDGDTDTKVYNMVCTQLATAYDPEQLELDVAMTSAAAAGVIELPFPADANAYFVGDTNHTSSEGGMLSFTRTFANIPQSTTIASGSEFYTFPGYAKSAVTVDDLYTEVGVTGIFVTLSAAHGLAVGDDAPLRNVRFYETADAPPARSDYKSFAVPDTSGWGNKEYFTDYEVLEVVDNVTFRVDPTISPSAPTAGEDLTVTQGDFFKDYGDGNITSMLVNPSGAGVLITTDVPHLAGQGEDLSINLQYKIDNSDRVNSINGSYKLISAPSATTFVIDIGRAFEVSQSLAVQPGGSFASTGDKNRSPISMNVSTELTYTYVIPGVTRGYATALDVKPAQQFQVYDVRDGSVVDTCYDFAVRNFVNLTFIRTQTSPTATEYARMVSTEADIVMESSVSEWAGNIFVIKTKTCKAR